MLRPPLPLTTVILIVSIMVMAQLNLGESITGDFGTKVGGSLVYFVEGLIFETEASYFSFLFVSVCFVKGLSGWIHYSGSVEGYLTEGRTTS